MRIVQTLLGKHRRAEVRKQVGFNAETEYPIFDPDGSKPVGDRVNRFDQVCAAALADINSPGGAEIA